ncbi:MAG TPA: hypothetical protein VI248_13840 [Kineosporiaceae bacterium]
MSAPAAIPLRYVLPTTALTLSAAVRKGVVVDDQGGHLEPEVAVALWAPWHPQPLWSVRSVNPPEGTASRSPSTAPGSLRRAFDRAHPRTAALIADLSARAEQYLAGLRMGDDPAQVVTFGQALEVVHRELAAADRTRREWISRQGRTVRSGEWDLSGADMITVIGLRPTLAPDTRVPEGGATELARDYGLLLALVTDEASAGTRSRTGSAGVAVYRRQPENLPLRETSDADPEWVRDDVLSRLWLADAGDAPAEVPRPRTPVDAERAVPAQPDRPLPGDALLEAGARVARTQLDLLDASDEYARLASTQYRTEEIDALQRQLRLAFRPGRALV